MLGAVLAGGANSRIPFVKGLIEIGGRRLAESSALLLKETAGEAVISTNSPELYFYMGYPLIGDVAKPAGPMTGIYSVLYSTGAEEVFAAACDMPFINPGLVRYIIENRGGEATVPVFDGRPEPLLAVYSRKAMDVFEERISEGRTSLRSFLDAIDVRYIREEEVRGIDPEGLSFFNINTTEDYEKALRAHKGGRECLV